ncbi:MAG: diphosphomevalonate decarboxylase, partial [Flavobacteriaceae bacterium]|nr:diphosphomevalonate decarboxylase [Flavobacteriaceae bacterium]
MTEKDFILNKADTLNLDQGSFTWQSPSNIALVKYWGKSDPQIPKNPSISFTLNNCHTTTLLEFS